VAPSGSAIRSVQAYIVSYHGSSPEKSEGFAVALLMWMIAGMSLLVTAVIHFAQDDIGLAEQRLAEARTEAAARGVALLVARDAALQNFGDAGAPRQISGPQSTDEIGSSDEDGRSRIFTRSYEFGDTFVIASMHPASGFVSLNGGSSEEMRRLFAEIGGVGQAQSANLAGAVIDYRTQRASNTADLENFPGFRAREELLAVQGMRKNIYERVKDYVQPYQRSLLNIDAAPKRLRAVFAGQANQGLGQGAGSAAGTSGKASGAVRSAASDGLVTFESIYRQKAAALAGNDAVAVLVEVVLPDDRLMSYRIWLSDSEQRVIRSERVASSLIRGRNQT